MSWFRGTEEHFEWGVMCKKGSAGPCEKHPIGCDDYEKALEKLKWFETDPVVHAGCRPHFLVFRHVGAAIAVVHPPDMFKPEPMEWDGTLRSV